MITGVDTVLFSVVVVMDWFDARRRASVLEICATSTSPLRRRFAAVVSLATTLNVIVSGNPASFAVLPLGPHVQSAWRFTTMESPATPESLTYGPLPYDLFMNSSSGLRMPAGQMMPPVQTSVKPNSNSPLGTPVLKVTVPAASSVVMLYGPSPNAASRRVNANS